jgi:hypothetical protein
VTPAVTLQTSFRSGTPCAMPMVDAAATVDGVSAKLRVTA